MRCNNSDIRNSVDTELNVQFPTFFDVAYDLVLNIGGVADLLSDLSFLAQYYISGDATVEDETDETEGDITTVHHVCKLYLWGQDGTTNIYKYLPAWRLMFVAFGGLPSLCLCCIYFRVKILKHEGYLLLHKLVLLG